MDNTFTMFILLGIFISGFTYFSFINETHKNSEYGSQSSLINYNFFLIPLFLLLIIMLDGFESAMFRLSTFAIHFILFVSIYYLILLVILKLLRKYVYPQIIVLLWTAPSIYYIFVYSELSFNNEQFIAIPYNINIINRLFALWLLGFISVLVKKIKEHFDYRKYILNGSKVVNDIDVLDVLDEAEYKLNLNKKNYEVVTSNYVDSPVTIGLWNKVIVLPNKKYDFSELTLIFMHELIHIKRSDAYAKLYLTICNALCWFNPIIWLSSKKCFEDIELSCDYGVMNQLEESQRKQYANLILKSVSSEKGFTTCLSANAKSLKYRLNSVLHPTKKHVFTLLIGIAVVLLGITWGSFELVASDSITLDIFERVEIKEIKNNINDEIIYCDWKDVDDLVQYLNSLELHEFADDRYRIYKDVDYVNIYYQTPDRNFNIRLYENNVVNYNYEFYYVNNIDWEYIQNQLIESTTIKVEFYNYNFKHDVSIIEAPTKYSIDNQIIYDKEYTGFNYYKLLGYKFNKVKLSFNNEVVSDIKIVDNNGLELEVDDEYFVDVKYNTTYKVYVSILKDNKIVDVEFTFDTFCDN